MIKAVNTLGEVLSQSEIDALLGALSSGEMDAEALRQEEKEKKIRSYDFKRALKFSKEQVRSLTRIYENYARVLTTYFSAQLRTLVQINVSSVEQLPYEEFIRSVPNKTILNIFTAYPLEGRMVMEVNPNIAYSLLDRVLGGPGTVVNRDVELTPLETNLIHSMFSKSLTQLEEPWSSIIELETNLEELEINPQFMQIASPNETVIVISLETKIGNTSGMINFCLPHVVLEPIIPKLSSHHWLSSQKNNSVPEEVEALESRVKKATVPLIAELGSSNITLNELLSLNVNEVIRLDQTIEDSVVLKVGNIPKFLAQPGVNKGKSAVQVTEVLKGDGDNV